MASPASFPLTAGGSVDAQSSVQPTTIAETTAAAAATRRNENRRVVRSDRHAATNSPAATAVRAITRLQNATVSACGTSSATSGSSASRSATTPKRNATYKSVRRRERRWRSEKRTLTAHADTLETVATNNAAAGKGNANKIGGIP